MKLTVKYRIGEFKIYDGNNSLIGQVKKFLNNRKLEVQNADKNWNVSIFQEGQTLFVKEVGKEAITCSLLYQTDGSGKIVADTIVRPPMPLKATISTKWGKLLIDQSHPKQFHIFLDQKEVGTVSHIRSLTKEIDITSDAIPLSYYCVIFSICFLMIRDNDIAIV